jgi:hypothetical protein
MRTLERADRDEPDAPNGLPWVFRVDAAVKILNGRRYLRQCGGGPECYPVPGLICLRHPCPADAPLRSNRDAGRIENAISDNPAVTLTHRGSVGPAGVRHQRP